MAINRCLERDGFCSRNAVNHCRVHKVLLDVQNTFNNKLENIKVSDLIRPGKDEYFGRFYVVLKVNLKRTVMSVYIRTIKMYMINLRL